MIRKSMPSGFDPMGGNRFSEKIMLEQRSEHDPEKRPRAVTRWVKTGFPKKDRSSKHLDRQLIQSETITLSAASPVASGLMAARDPRAGG
jgi:hypothetical protein